jgi:hypothetical protein
MGFPGAMPTGFPGLGGKGYKEMGYADAKDNGFSLSGSYGKFSGGIKMDDNSTVCDSGGNCIVTDELNYRGSNMPISWKRKFDLDYKR